MIRNHALQSSKPHSGDASDGAIGAVKAGESIVDEGSEENPLATNNIHFDGSMGLTPTAAAWTPGGSFETSFEQEQPLGPEVVKKGSDDVEIRSFVGSAVRDAAGDKND